MSDRPLSVQVTLKEKIVAALLQRATFEAVQRLRIRWASDIYITRWILQGAAYGVHMYVVQTPLPVRYTPSVYGVSDREYGQWISCGIHALGMKRWMMR